MLRSGREEKDGLLTFLTSSSMAVFHLTPPREGGEGMALPTSHHVLEGR
jgi:hypothetical protein